VRVAFLGNAAWSVPSLEALAASSHDVVLVLTRVPKPAGRGNRLTPTPVAETARRLGVPLREVETVKSGSGFDALQAARPEILVVVAYGEILPEAILDVPSVAPVNVHFSLLPALRGAAPVQRAILQGLDRTGVTTIRMDAGLDTGPILLQAEEPIRPEDDSGSLGSRLATLGGRVLVKTIDGRAAGRVEERPQDDRHATLAPKLTAADRAIDWAEDAEAIVRRVRALAPDPGATTTIRGRGLKVFAAAEIPPEAGALPAPALPGTLLGGSKQLAVASGNGLVRLLEVAPEGRRRMSGEEFARGLRPEPGERLG
jgi:methionyl-tRNA formyltransferase